ncbi:hypothetical protein MBLNU230_g4556t1 [Neophaeotheca triangularis]
MQPEAISTAVASEDLEIPLIDFQAFLTGDEATKRLTAQAILSGFRKAGFVYLRNHGIPKPSVTSTFAQSAAFFARPQWQKDQLSWTTPEANRGYVSQGREKVTDLQDADDIEALRAAEGADLKESLEIGRENEPGHANSWPDGFDAQGVVFKRQMQDFFTQCKDVHVLVMRAIAVGLGIEESWFDGYCDGGDNTLRLLHYPAVRADSWTKKPGQVRAGAHTDYGSITLLFQDMAGGLQVQSPRGEFVDATPIEDTIVVNAGDLLARWSNDLVKSTKHRVVEPGRPAVGDWYPARYSIAYFCNPNFDRFIDAIPGTVGQGEVKRYEGVNSGEYLVQRLSATY